MYNVSNLYKNVINNPERLFKISIRIEHENGTLHLNDEHLAMGSFNVLDASQSGDEFTVGGTVAKHIEFTLVNSKEYEHIKFMGAKVIPTVSLMVREAVDAHFMQPSQPSEIPGFEDLWEDVPIGHFHIDVVDRLRNTIEIKAMDNMILLDKPYELSGVSYPISLIRILNDICMAAGVGLPHQDFPNKNYIARDRPEEGKYTLRNIVGFVAELAGSFATFDRNGRLQLRWYEDTDKVITKHQRSEFELGDFEAQITGVMIEGEPVEGDPVGGTKEEAPTYLVGTDDYAIDLTGNILLRSNYEQALPVILNNIEHTKFTPYTAVWNGDPAIDVGDIVTHIDLDGVERRVVVTNTNYKYMGASEMSGRASPNIVRGFKSSDNRIATIIGKIEADTSSKLSSLQQEQMMATELIGNMLGGYVSHITPRDELEHQQFGDGIFIHDAPKLTDSMKIWKWGIGGFGFSDDGGVTYMTGVTIDGSIVANIVSANHINTGTLSSNKGNSWISMDTGEFELGGMRLIDNEFSLTLQDLDMDGQKLSDRLATINANMDGISASVSNIVDDYVDTAQLNIAAGSIESTVKSYTDDEVSKAENRISQTVSGISATVSRIDRDYVKEAQITVLENQISSKVSITDYNGDTIASKITQSPAAIDLIASKITITADNIDLDGITRVNSDLRVGSVGERGAITLSDRSSIKTTGVSGYTLTLDSLENHLTCTQLHFNASNIHYKDDVILHNPPYMTPYSKESLGYTLDYSAQWNQLVVRKKGSPTILGRINLT